MVGALILYFYVKSIKKFNILPKIMQNTGPKEKTVFSGNFLPISLKVINIIKVENPKTAAALFV